MRESWGIFPLFRSCQTHLSCQRSAVLETVDRCQHGEGAVGILHQAAIAHLGKAPQALEGQEGMLDLGADTRLAAVRRSGGRRAGVPLAR